MSFRYLDTKFEALAGHWRNQVYTEQEWTEETAPRWEGDSGTVLVRGSGKSKDEAEFKEKLAAIEKNSEAREAAWQEGHVISGC